jgi:hypothetical protein
MAKEIEILVLRHQLAVLQRRAPQPRMNWTDRALIAALTRLFPSANASLLVTPATILRWHPNSSLRDCGRACVLPGSGTAECRAGTHRHVRGCSIAVHPCTSARLSRGVPAPVGRASGRPDNHVDQRSRLCSTMSPSYGFYPVFCCHSRTAKPSWKTKATVAKIRLYDASNAKMPYSF